MNIPVFAIPGMMPTRHPVAESYNYTDYRGGIKLELFRIPTDQLNPDVISVMITDYSGTIFLNLVTMDVASDPHIQVREVDGDNVYTFVFGNDVEGWLPAGTFYVHVLSQAADVDQVTLNGQSLTLGNIVLVLDDPDVPTYTVTLGTFRFTIVNPDTAFNQNPNNGFVSGPYPQDLIP